MSLHHLGWALGAEGLNPVSKLVLVLAGNACDQDGLVFEPYDELIRLANLEPDALVDVVAELTRARMATFAIAEFPATGAQVGCIRLLCPEALTDGR